MQISELNILHKMSPAAAQNLAVLWPTTHELCLLAVQLLPRQEKWGTRKEPGHKSSEWPSASWLTTTPAHLPPVALPLSLAGVKWGRRIAHGYSYSWSI